VRCPVNSGRLRCECPLLTGHLTLAILEFAAELISEGDYKRAEMLCKETLAAKEKIFGPNHPDVSASLENMAALYRKTDRGKAAEEVEKRAAAIRAKNR
jgi:hypothetical protein